MTSKVQAFTQNGKILMAALDHRGSFNKLVGPNVSDGDIINTKEEIIEALYPDISGILVDPKWGLKAYEQYCQKQNIESKKPYLLSIEKTGYSEEKGERIAELEYTVEQFKELGASGVKLLLYVNPHLESFSKQLEIARSVLSDCKAHDLPLFLEFLTYTLDEQSSKSELILESVGEFLEEGVIPDVFKLEFPENEESCKKLTKMLSDTPWILLTFGASFDTFKQELQSATQNGCSGFLAGRSLWQDFVQYKREERKEFFQTTVKERFKEIVEIAR